MGYLYGEVETETKNQGMEAHENLLKGSEAVGQEDIWKSVYGKEPVLSWSSSKRFTFFDSALTFSTFKYNTY